MILGCNKDKYIAPNGVDPLGKSIGLVPKENENVYDTVVEEDIQKEENVDQKEDVIKKESTVFVENKVINYCPNCGNKLNKTAKFCPNCGERIK